MNNLENEFTSPTDDLTGGGDIINPMEAAQYYYGSFQDQNAFAQATLAEYRSQESEEDDEKIESADIEVQEVDDMPDDVKLRIKSTDPSSG